MAYLLYVTTLLTTIRRIVEFTEQFQRGMTGIERFLEVVDAPVDIHDAPGAKELRDVAGDIAFEHVAFHYSDDDHCVLSDINLHVRPGGQRGPWSGRRAAARRRFAASSRAFTT